MSGKYPGGFVQLGAPAGYSVAFDGTGDYLSVANNAALNVGSGNFCIEAWFNVATIASQQIVVSNAGAAGSDNTQIDIVSGNVRFTSAATLYLTGSAVTTNTWNHVAVCRSGTTLSLFVNGVRQATATNSTNFANANNYAFNTAGAPGYSGSFTGYISNVRIVKGSAVYDPTQTTILVPTQLFPITNTSLLTCQSPSIIDVGTANSGSPFTVTANGDAKVSTFTPFTGYTAGAAGFNPARGSAAPGIWTLDEATNYQANRLWPIYDPYFNLTTLKLGGNIPTNLPTWITDASTNNFPVTVVGSAKAASQTPFSLTSYPNSGSGFFNGTTDYLTIAANAANLVGSGDYTFEAWVYVPAVASLVPVISYGATGATFRFFLNSNNPWLLIGGTSIMQPAGGSLTANTWIHLAVVRSGSGTNNNAIYVNGTRVSQTTNTSNFNAGSPSIANEGTSYFSGYMSNVRLVTQALYNPANSTITVPTAPLTPVSGTQILTLQNSQPTANSSFTDSSSNNFAITRLGNTTQGTFTPFNQTGWSDYNASTASLCVGIYLNGETDFAFGTGDFTIEMWVNLQPKTPGHVLYDSRPDATNAFYPTVYVDGSVNKVKYFTNAADRITQTSTFTYNVWHHIVVTRTGTSTKMFVDGVQEGSTYTDSNTYINGASRPFTGDGFTPNPTANGYGVLGYISNLRVVKGSGPYQSAGSSITVPTTPLTPITNTVLLTLQSNRFLDTNTQVAAKTINLFNGPSIQAFSPFAPTAAYGTSTVGGSGYFDGAGDYLSLPTNTATTLSNSNFTAEAWIYPTATVSSTQMIIGSWDGSTTLSWTLNLGATNGIGFSWTNTGSYIPANDISAGNNSIKPNSWNHVAAVRNGATLTIYVNGVSSASSSGLSTTSFFSAPNNTKIGSNTNNQHFLGYISNARLIVGTAVYTGSFTVPTAPFTASMSANPFGGSNTAAATSTLLLNYTNTGIYDAAAKNDLETVGTAAVSTVQSKYGGSSISIGGTGSYLTDLANYNYNFETGDFTVEAWIYLSSTPATYAGIIDTRAAGGATTNWAFGIFNSTGLKIDFVYGATRLTGTTSISTTSWVHVAVTRAGGTIRLFVNGTQDASATYTSAINTGSTIAWIGAVKDPYYFTGYIQDLRVTKGYARYVANFTPPTSLLQNQ